MSAPTFWAEFLGGEVRYYDAGGVRTRCLEAGQGQPLVLLHGAGGHAEGYIRNVLPLAEHLHVYAIDMAGHGFTGDVSPVAGRIALVDHLVAFLDAIGAERADLCGLSLGGWVGAWTSILHPQRVRRLVYLCGAGLAVDAEATAAAAPGRAAFQRLTRQAVAEPTRDSVRQRLAWLFRDPERSVTEDLLETRYRIYTRRFGGGGETPRRGDGSPEPNGAEWSLTPERLARIPAPTLFLWSEHNPTTPWSAAERASRLVPGARFQVIHDVGHWPQYEAADEFNQVVGDFLAG